MGIYQITYSPTGGTKRVADQLTAPWGDVTSIDLCDPGKDCGQAAFTPADVCFAAVPSYGGRVPAAALGRLKQMAGGGARAVAVVAYGNRAYDDTLLELRDALLAAGFRCPAAVAAVAEHSILRQFASGRPDAQDRQELTGFAGRIQACLEGGGQTPVAVPGHAPYRAYAGLPIRPKAGRRCNGCGLCAAQCPVGAIHKADPRRVDKSLCTTCMRCVAVCPQKARRIHPLLLSAAALGLKGACAGRKGNELYLCETPAEG